MAHLTLHGHPSVTRFDFPAERVVIGRSPSADLMIDDPRVSRVHVVFERLAGTWFVTDHSANGTRLNGDRLYSRTPLRSTSRLEIGEVLLVFHDPDQPSVSTKLGVEQPQSQLTGKEREALGHLCLPLLDSTHFPAPQTVAQISAAMFVSEARILQLLNDSARKLGLHGQLDRAALAETAMRTGHITREELADLRRRHDRP